jgi:hypothetical protein
MLHNHASRVTYHVPRVPFYASFWPGLALWLGGALLVGLLYLAVAAWGFGVSGFPLDDAWIHQTYARNLARAGQLAFVPGRPSAGSTAPLWTFLLSAGYLLGLPFQPWTYGLGLGLLGLTGWTVARLGLRLFPEIPWAGGWTGLFCLLEWHLIWAAVSGMETLLFTWLSLFLFERYLAGSSTATWRWAFGLGILGGLLVLTRPEGLGLVGLVGLDMIFRTWRKIQNPAPGTHPVGYSEASQAKSKIQNLGVLLLGLSLSLSPYLIFHLQLTGLLFPNTLYAKQAEYGKILSAFPLWWRLFGGLSPPETVQGVFRVIFIGAQLLLLPGLALAGWLTFKERRCLLWPVWVWWLSYLMLYASRLPVTYQHGRYQIPTIAWMVLLGVWGTARLVEGQRRPGLLRALSRALVLSVGLLLLAFLALGAQAYGRDVRFIENEMVATAHWLDEQTGPEALIAAHDIGAIGYFSQRPLIDLAGLITPEVIPFIQDEPALLEFITAQKAEYLVTFPSWYPEMTKHPNLTPIYETGAPETRQIGGDNMVVYRIEEVK